MNTTSQGYHHWYHTSSNHRNCIIININNNDDKKLKDPMPSSQFIRSTLLKMQNTAWLILTSVCSVSVCVRYKLLILNKTSFPHLLYEVIKSLNITENLLNFSGHLYSHFTNKSQLKP